MGNEFAQLGQPHRLIARSWSDSSSQSAVQLFEHVLYLHDNVGANPQRLAEDCQAVINDAYLFLSLKPFQDTERRALWGLVQRSLPLPQRFFPIAYTGLHLDRGNPLHGWDAAYPGHRDGYRPHEHYYREDVHTHIVHGEPPKSGPSGH